MRTTEVSFEGRLPVDGYAPGGFRVEGAVHLRTARAGAGGDRGLGRSARPRAVPGTGGAASTFCSSGPGPRSRRRRRRSPRRRARLEAAGAGVDLMATPSACRTYNVLLAEGRRVAAALMPI